MQRRSRFGAITVALGIALAAGSVAPAASAAPRPEAGQWVLPAAPDAAAIPGAPLPTISTPRLPTPAPRTTSTFTSSSGTVRYEFSGAGLYGYDKRKVVTGTGSAVRISPGYGWSGFGSDVVQLHVEVQRDTGTGWRTMSTSSYPVGDVDVTVPVFTTKAKQRVVRYRLHSAAYASTTSTVENDSYSDPVTVVYENQRRYTGLAKRMYGYLKPYCPQTAVHVTRLIDGNPSLAGQAAGAGQTIWIKAADATMPAAYQRAVALHECGHVHQWLNYGSTYEGDRISGPQERKYFINDSPPAGVGWPYSPARPADRFSALEHAADCGSIAVNPKGYLGYGGYCNPSERKRAKWLLLGRQYNGKPAIPS